MEIFISIDGVLRNLIQKFELIYINNLMEAETVEEEVFEYGINKPITNINLMDSFKFQSIEEYENFKYFDFPLDIFGYSSLSYNNAMFDLNQLINENKKIKFTLIGLDEFAKAKPSTLFFLSKTGCLADKIEFIKSKDIKKKWKKCDLWLTDNKEIIDLCPFEKKVVKFETEYNQNISTLLTINKIINLKEKW